MFVKTVTATKEQMLQQIEQFTKLYPDAFFYKESLQAFTLAPIAKLKLDDIQSIRLFNQSAELKIKAMRNSYQIVQFTTEPLANSTEVNFFESRTLLLDQNYVNGYSKLQIEIYNHDKLGQFEIWKGVVSC